MKRQIVKIDEEKCTGCGLCVPACAEGAIQIIDGKARLIADNLCDGLGACLGDCPEDAITIEEREAEEFNEGAVEAHLKELGETVPVAAAGTAEKNSRFATARGSVHRGHSHPTPASGHGIPSGGCPSARVLQFDRKPQVEEQGSGSSPQSVQSRLGQWPVQLALVPPTAPYFQDAHLLVVADCVPFAYGEFHRDFLEGKAIVVGCPKLDNGEFYVEKLTQILTQSSIQSVTVLHMEVPCCFGINQIARKALERSGKEITYREINIGVDGKRKS